MPSFSDFTFASSTGKNHIHARQCMPDGAPRAVLQIAHGIAEHIERYDDFASFLAQNGILVVGNDHLGHGKSVSAPEDLGFFAEDNGWDHVVQDMDKLHDLIKADHPDLPYIFFGHSMGSFLTRTYIVKHPEKPDLVILSGTGHQSKALVYSGYAMAEAIVRAKGPRADGRFLNDLAFGAYNKKVPFPMTDFDWLSQDHEMVRKYINDPLCGFVAKASLYRDMMGGIKFVTDQKNIDAMNKDTPVYFMSGDKDPVGDYGKGVERAYKAFCQAGLRDVFMRLYPDGRHEMLNELNRQQVYQDVLDWIEPRLKTLHK